MARYFNLELTFIFAHTIKCTLTQNVSSENCCRVVCDAEEQKPKHKRQKLNLAVLILKS